MYENGFLECLFHSSNVCLIKARLGAKKRLFMTATERIIRPWVQQRAEQANQTVFSMDDESVYGRVFDRYTFGEAIQDGVICDYKLVITAIQSSDVANLIDKNRLITEDTSSNQHMTAENLYKQIILCKAIQEYNLRKTITFHSSIQRARNFINGASNTNPSFQNILSQGWPVIKLENSSFSSIDGQMSAGDRNIRLREFEKSSIAVISNAKCLTEGIDLPMIDSIYFVDPKNSLIDIVQACGRALRKPRTNTGKGDAYFIVPVVISDETDVNEMDDSVFETVHNVIQALRNQDERMADWIDQINIGAARGGGSSKFLGGPIIINLPSQFDFQSFVDSIQLRIARINREPSIGFREEREVVRRSSFTKSFMPFGDYSHETYLNQLVSPTIKKFEGENDELSPNEIKINHNNISHTLRVGLIEKTNGNYKLTELGRNFKNEHITFQDVMKKSMLNFESKLAENLFPYRTILKVLLRIKKFNYIEFLFGLYTLNDSSTESLEESIKIIKEIHEQLPNISILSNENKKNVLDNLNKKYGFQFTFDEAWGSTTPKNKFGYFKNHLNLFDEITLKGDEILLEETGNKNIEDLVTLEK